MSSQQSDAEKKFWGCPELVKHLLSFLDLRSTLHLAKEHQLSRKTLEDKHNWKKLVDQKILFRKNEITLHWKRWTTWQRSFSWWKLQECLCCGNCYTRFVRDFLSTLSPQSSLSPQLKDWISSARTMKSLTGSLLSDLALLGLFFDVSGVKRNCSQCFFPFDTKSILWTIKFCAKRWIEMKSHLKQFILILILLLDILIQSTSL